MPALAQSFLNILMSRAAEQANVSFLQSLPTGYDDSIISFIDRKALAVMPEQAINRTVWQSPWTSAETIEDAKVKEDLEKVQSTPFVAYDKQFLQIIGQQPKIEKIMNLSQHIHEGPTYIPSTNQLFFTEWGEGDVKGGFAQHNWQWWLDVGSIDEKVENIKANNVTLNPPIQNAHGSFYYDKKVFVVTDGGNGTHASLIELDPKTKEHKTLVNNYYLHPFDGFNDLAISPNGKDVYMSDTSTAFDHGITTVQPGNPGFTWLYNRDSGEVRAVGTTLSKGNGVTVSPDGKALVVSDTGASGKDTKDPLGNRSLTRYTLSSDGTIDDSHIIATPIAGLYDGLRFTGSGKYLIGASYEGLDFLDAKSGKVYGTIQVQKGDSTVNFAFRSGGVIYVVGKGGVYRIKIAEECAWSQEAFTK